jgi:predicted Zn-dependent protease
MAQQMGGAVDPRADAAAALVADVGQRLVQRSDASKSPYVGNFNFYLLRDPDTINAFALPGGQIFITRGLLNRLENESQLAGVLGHEIGHVIGRHAAEHMAKGQLGQMLTVAVGVGASGNESGGYQQQMIAAMVNQMFQLRFGRKDESESDQFGLKYMTQAGYDPRGMIRVMEVLAQASRGGRSLEIFQTHPDPARRLEDIKAWLAQTYPNGVPSDLSTGRSLPGNR